MLVSDLSPKFRLEDDDELFEDRTFGLSWVQVASIIAEKSVTDGFC